MENVKIKLNSVSAEIVAVSESNKEYSLDTIVVNFATKKKVTDNLVKKYISEYVKNNSLKLINIYVYETEQKTYSIPISEITNFSVAE